MLCVISRGIAIPMYLRQLGFLSINPDWDTYFNLTSKFFLFAGGITGTLLILYQVIRAHRKRSGLQKTLRVVKQAAYPV